ncbi:MAG TPA: hypothetical protein VFA75_05800 [Nevskia sp.]|nr:hypothetical protein [Nevskia sp.]
MKANLSGLPILLLLASCAAAPPPQAQPAPAAAADPPAAASDCAGLEPWTRASKALNRPVVDSTAGGKPVHTIKGVTYAEILNDHDLTGGVKLTDPQGREPAPGTVYNIVWTSDEDTESGGAGGCRQRYSAPTFFDVR